MRKTNEQNSKNKKQNTNKGITLIALIITIIVMLILVAVTISMAINGGLFEYAGKAVGDTQDAIDAEQELASGKIKIGNTVYNSINEYLGGGTNEGLPIEWNSLDVLDNTSFILQGTPFVKVSNIVLSAEELSKTYATAREGDFEVIGEYDTLQSFDGINLISYTVSEIDFTLGVISVEQAGAYDELGIEISETGIYAMNFGMEGSNIDFCIGKAEPIYFENFPMEFVPAKLNFNTRVTEVFDGEINFEMWGVKISNKQLSSKELSSLVIGAKSDTQFYVIKTIDSVAEQEGVLISEIDSLLSLVSVSKPTTVVYNILNKSINMTFEESGLYLVGFGSITGEYAKMRYKIGTESNVYPVELITDNNITYSLYKNGKLTISGEGRMIDYEENGLATGVLYMLQNYITEVEILDGITHIGKWMFEGMSVMKNITIPNSVTSIGTSAFSGAGITEITIPENVTAMGSNAFVECDDLSIINMLPQTPPETDGNGGAEFISTESLTAIYVPAGCGNAYKEAEPWKKFADYIVEVSE